MTAEINRTTKHKSNARVSDKVRDYGNDPFFVKMTEESKEFLEKHGFPKDLVPKKMNPEESESDIK